MNRYYHKPHRTKRQRVPQIGNLGWRAYEDGAMANSVAQTYVARCREAYRPNDFYSLTQTEGGAPRHYPVLIVKNPEARRLHLLHSGFKVV